MILQRIKEYIDYKGITVAAFERSVGMSNASFGKSLKNNGAIGTDKLENILSIYKDISPLWLLTGTGPMLLNPPVSAQSSPSPVSDKESLTLSGRAAGGNATASGTHSIAAINSAVNASPPSPDASLRRENELLRSLIDEKERLLAEKERLISVLMERK